MPMWTTAEATPLPSKPTQLPHGLRETTFGVGEQVQVRTSDGWISAAVVSTMILDDEGRAYCYHCRMENDDYVFVPRDGATHILAAFDCGDELRFRIGDTVACLFDNRWSLGKVTKHWWRDENDARWPYQVRLNDGGSLIFAPCDHNESICTEEDAEALTELMQEKLMQSERETVLVGSAPKQKKKKKKKKKRGKGQGPPNLEAESSLESIESIESVEDIEPVAEAEASDDENDGCVVCFEADKTHLSVTCGHLCVCERCSAKLSACPFCRVPSPQWLRVFKV